MEMTGVGYQKSELVRIAEQIYEYKRRKQESELALHSEEFHYKYIGKRKNLVWNEVLSRLLIIAPLTSLIMGTLWLMAEYLQNLIDSETTGSDGVVFLFSFLFFAFGSYVDVQLIRREAKMIMLLFISNHSEKAMNIAEQLDLTPFQIDKEKSERTIAMLKEQIATFDKRITELEKQEEQLIAEKEQKEETLRQKGVLFDENPNQPPQDGKFTLKEDTMWIIDGRELHEFYLKEEQFINKQLIWLDGKLQYTEKKLVDIEKDFEEVKRVLKFSAIIYLVLIILHVLFPGVMEAIINLICLIGGPIYIFYLEKKCKEPVLNYLVEHDSNLTKDYAFCNSMTPVKVERDELLQRIKQYKNELIEIKKKKEAIVF